MKGDNAAPTVLALWSGIHVPEKWKTVTAAPSALALRSNIHSTEKVRDASAALASWNDIHMPEKAKDTESCSMDMTEKVTMLHLLHWRCGVAST